MLKENFILGNFNLMGQDEYLIWLERNFNRGRKAWKVNCISWESKYDRGGKESLTPNC